MKLILALPSDTLPDKKFHCLEPLSIPSYPFLCSISPSIFLLGLERQAQAQLYTILFLVALSINASRAVLPMQVMRGSYCTLVVCRTKINSWSDQ
jgi:hypothetical protein